MTKLTTEELEFVRENAEQLFSNAEVAAAMDQIAVEITRDLSTRNPVVLAVMNGGMVPAAMLLDRLHFPLEIDYIHLTRYGDLTTGGEIEWIRRPSKKIAGRTVLLIDDLLDHGVTLQSAIDACVETGADEVFTAVLLVKSVLNRRGLAVTDYFGLTAPDRYVFGSGMDYKNYWRNCPGIFALKDND
ncbi:MAG: hypoxanthine-guanine phosphoribosyltransferase [Proteobacteria bacterium]|nr:hypoxanthine-guanine phosphoribosyltransferase [Pseudomonadota bacterium]